MDEVSRILDISKQLRAVMENPNLTKRQAEKEFRKVYLRGLINSLPPGTSIRQVLRHKNLVRVPPFINLRSY